MARVIGIDDIRDAIGALRLGETTIADLENLIRDALAAGTLSRSDANRVLRTVRATEPPDTTLDAEKPRVRSDARARASTETRIRITGASGTNALWVDPDPAAVSPDGPTMVGQLLGGRYLLERELGGGGMGVVYLASDQEIAGEVFAIKVLKPEIRAYPEALPLLREEVRTTRALRHPNIVGVYSLNSDKRNIYMLMEYLEGKTLDALLNEEFGRGMPFSRAWPLIHDMCDALAYAHDHNVIHSDLKPSNVFVTIAGQAKLLDFGIARVARTRNGRFDPGTLAALTLAYASMEMLEGNKPDQRDDVYALACVIYEMLSGRHPYELHSALEARVAQMAVAPIVSLNASQNAALAQALAVGRANRTSTVEALLAGLDASTPAAGTAGTKTKTLLRGRRDTVPFAGAVRPTPISPATPRISKSLMIALISVVSILVLGGLIFLVYRERARSYFAAVTPSEPVIAIDRPAEPAVPQAAPPVVPQVAAPVDPPVAPRGNDDAKPSAADTELPSAAPILKPTAPASLPTPHAARPPVQSEPSEPNLSNTSGLPAVGKHPISVMTLPGSTDSCPYPRAAMDLGLTGSVGLFVFISPEGEAIDTRLAETSGSEQLDQAAVACIQKQGRFAAKHLGSKVPGYWGHMRYNFSFGGIE